MKKKKTAKKSGQSLRKSNHPQQQQHAVKERIFQVRRQAQFLTRAVEIKATNYDTLKAEAAKAFNIEDLDSFTLRELFTCDSYKEKDIQEACFPQIASDLLITPKDELPLMPGFHRHLILHFKASVWKLFHMAKKSEYGFTWVDNINSEIDECTANFYPAKLVLSYPQSTLILKFLLNRIQTIAYHFRKLMTSKFVIYFDKQETIMCFHPGDLFSQFKKGPLCELTESNVILFMKKIDSIPEEKFWARINEISRGYSDHGGLRTKAMNDETLGNDYFPDFEVDDPHVAEGVNAIMDKVKNNIPPDLTDEWCCENIKVFGVRSTCGLNWFHLCCFLNNIQWLKFIDKYAKRAGISINDKGGLHMMTPLCIAVLRGNIDSVKECVNLGADVNIPADGELRRRNFTALHYAAENNPEDICSYLVKTCKMNVNEQTKEKNIPLLLTNSASITSLLFAHGAKASYLISSDGNNLVRYNRDIPYVDLLRVYLAHGGKKIVNVSSGPVDTTPLSRLCYTAQLNSDETFEAMKLLIEAGADVNIADKYGTTPLISISQNTQCDVQDCIERYVKLLLDAGARFDKVRGHPRGTIMNSCIKRSDWLSVLHLLEHGAILTKEQKDVIYSSGNLEVIGKIKSIEETREERNDNPKNNLKETQKKEGCIITDMNEKVKCGKEDKKEEEEEEKKENLNTDESSVNENEKNNNNKKDEKENENINTNKNDENKNVEILEKHDIKEEEDGDDEKEEEEKEEDDDSEIINENIIDVKTVNNNGNNDNEKYEKENENINTNNENKNVEILEKHDIKDDDDDDDDDDDEHSEVINENIIDVKTVNNNNISNDNDNNSKQEITCMTQTEFISIDVYLKLKEKHEKMLKQFEENARMLVSEEEKSFNAEITINSMQNEIDFLKRENSLLKNMVSNLEEQNKELLRQQQQQQSAFLPQLRQFSNNGFTDTLFRHGPVQNVSIPSFKYEEDEDDSDLLYST